MPIMTQKDENRGCLGTIALLPRFLCPKFKILQVFWVLLSAQQLKSSSFTVHVFVLRADASKNQ